MVYIDVGKIIMFECILFYIGKSYKIGEVYDGVVIMDWMEQEQECGIMIQFVVIIVFWKGMDKFLLEYCFNIIDIFGYVDFIIEVECLFCVFDGVVFVLCVVGGVQLQLEIVWCQVNKYYVLCIVFVNKMDCIGVNFQKVVGQLKVKLGVVVVLMQLLIGVEDNFKGVVDLLKMKVIYWDEVLQGMKFEYSDILVELQGLVEEVCQFMVEIVVEVSEELMEKYLGGEELVEVEIINVLCICILVIEIVLMYCGLVFKNKGVQVMLDGVIQLLLLLVDVLDVKGVDVDDDIVEMICKLDDKVLFLLLVFKIIIDLFVGVLIFFCVYLGILNGGDIVLNLVKGKKECIGCILQMYLNNCEEIKEVLVGDIVVVVGLKDIIIGDILCVVDVLIILECMMFLELVILMVVELKIKLDQEKMGLVLGCLVQEDLLFCVKIDEEFGQIIILGMGELYLDIIVDCLKCEFNVEVNVGVLQVVYCEIIILVDVKLDYKYVKQFGGKGQYGYVVIELLLIIVVDCVDLKIVLMIKDDFLFINDIIGGVILKEFILLVEKGLCEIIISGLLVGFLVVDVKVKLVFGLYYDVDFLEMVFKLVLLMVFKQGFVKVKLVLLELIMKVEIVILEDYQGDVMGDVSCCCGVLQGFDIIGDGLVSIINVMILLGEMFGYVIVLCLQIQGCVIFIMEFDYYELVLINIVEVVMKKG